MCDTFVALPAATTDGSVIFAKNSDRPYDEIQNITHYPHQEHYSDATVQCTYIEIPQVEETYSVLLSQPSWMFGAEMGANEHSVVIGNEAVWTREPCDFPVLLGMDLIRLALERSKSAHHAFLTIVELLESYGQGGSFSKKNFSSSYHNSFLIADREEAWVLEAAGRWWVAERVKEPTRHISNNLSIGTNFDLSSEGIIDYAIEESYYDETGPFHFARAFSEGYCGNDDNRCFYTNNYGKITPLDMITLLRDHRYGFCWHGGFRTTASMVSHLRGSYRDIHWMTGTPHPCKSLFKPICFPITSLKPYIPATHKKDLESIWWAHEKIANSISIKTTNWKQKEKEFYTMSQSADSNQITKITSQAFISEINLYKSILND
ncbi:MAG: C69 family dipeptidase [Promethearchaeota archaeon]